MHCVWAATMTSDDIDTDQAASFIQYVGQMVRSACNKCHVLLHGMELVLRLLYWYSIVIVIYM